MIKPLNDIELNKYLTDYFKFFDLLVEWWINDESNSFHIYDCVNLVNIPEKKLSLKERINYINTARISDIILPKKFLICNVYNHIEYSSDWIYKKYRHNKFVRESSKYFLLEGVPKKLFFSSRGFICSEIEPQDFFKNIFFLPFLMEWDDICILDLDGKDISIINHHMSLLRIKKEE